MKEDGWLLTLDKRCRTIHSHVYYCSFDNLARKLSTKSKNCSLKIQKTLKMYELFQKKCCFPSNSSFGYSECNFDIPARSLIRIRIKFYSFRLSKKHRKSFSGHEELSLGNTKFYLSNIVLTLLKAGVFAPYVAYVYLKRFRCFISATF